MKTLRRVGRGTAVAGEMDGGRPVQRRGKARMLPRSAHMRLRIGWIPAAALVAAGCGGNEGRVSIRGAFADPAQAPTSVFAVEAEREAEVKNGAFAFRGLSAGPVTLRLVHGADTLGVLALSSLPAGAVVELRGVRVDTATHLAFADGVGLTGPEAVTANGLRVTDAARIPTQVDAHGTVLAIADDRDALLLRPDDPALPDLRVVVGASVETVTPDGDPVEDLRLSPGDSLRVQGRTDQGFVVAEKLVVPRRRAVAAAPASDAGGGDEPPAARRASSRARAAAPPAPPPPPLPVRMVRELRDRIEGRGHGRGRGRGHGKKG